MGAGLVGGEGRALGARALCIINTKGLSVKGDVEYRAGEPERHEKNFNLRTQSSARMTDKGCGAGEVTRACHSQER